MGALDIIRRLFGPVATDPALDDRYWKPVGALYGRTSAGVVIDPDTSKRISAVYRCISLLSNALATLPFGVFERQERGRREILTHSAYQAFAIKPNPYQVPLVFKRMMMGHLVLRGNCYARIVRTSTGFELWPLHPSRVGGPELLETGRLRYRYIRPDNNREERLIGGQDIWHLTALSDDGLKGLATADLASETFGLAMAAEQHGAKVFGKGVRLAGALKTTGTMGAEAKKELSKAFRDEHADFGLPVLEDGLDFVSMGMTSEQAQYLESRKFSVSDIARWFGIPPHMVGDVERSTSWGTGIENQTIQFVTDGLLPWVQLWEESIDEVFIPEANLYSKFNVNARLRADSKTRSDIARTYVEIGVWSPNDVREMEDENPRDGGDVYVTPRSPNEPAPRGGGAPEGPPPPDDDETDERAWLREAIGGLARANAQAIVSEERAELTRLAKQHAKDSNAWRAAVASFYGRWAGRIAGFATDQDAKSYCERRRDSVLTNGLKAQEDEAGAVTSLAALLTAATSGGSNAAA